MTLTFHPAARDEFVAAAAYYEAAMPGLGSRFQNAVRRTTDLVLVHPDVGSPRACATLACVRIPVRCGLLGPRRGDRGVGGVHHHRRPGYWRSRLRG
ncbi:MAG: type II toxin-antitoxin system RelE/ParE family toxin [Gemmatimonadetes bacterium]|nr:type II toxin-antitoxin system RelE/ParE family toxin [Gemmatimonadota bacterium]